MQLENWIRRLRRCAFYSHSDNPFHKVATVRIRLARSETFGMATPDPGRNPTARLIPKRARSLPTLIAAICPMSCREDRADHALAPTPICRISRGRTTTTIMHEGLVYGHGAIPPRALLARRSWSRRMDGNPPIVVASRVLTVWPPLVSGQRGEPPLMCVGIGR